MMPMLDRRRLWRRGAVAMIATAIVNLVILGAGLAADVPFVVPGTGDTGPVEITAAPVLMFTILPMAIGLGMATLAHRRPDALRWIRILAVVITVVSLIPPLVADTDTSTRLLLAVMHPTTGGAFLWALRPETITSPPEPEREPADTTGVPSGRGG